MVARLDGLVITGGADVDRLGVRRAAHTRAGDPRPDRDAWELALLDAADELRLPMLGVCRGMQVMAVRAGGALEQHLPDLVGHEHHSPGGDVFGDVDGPGRRGAAGCATWCVPTSSGVHCHHHQSVRDHPGFTAVAWADDGTLEAMEACGGPVLPGRAVAPGGGRRRGALPGPGRR